MSQPPLNDANPLDKYMVVEFMRDDHIAYCHIEYPDTSRENVDHFCLTLQATMDKGMGKPAMGIVFDMRKGNISLTPYLRARAKTLYENGRLRKVFIVFLTENNVATQFIRFFIRTFDSHRRKNVVFFTRDEALEWVNKQLDAEYGALDQ